MRRKKKIAGFNLGRALIFTIIIILVALGPFPAPDVFAAGCYGSTCTGKWPSDYGCDADAYNAIQTLKSGALIQKRNSDACYASWARTFNDSGVYKYTAASIIYPYPTYSSHYSNSSDWKIASGLSMYTKMVSRYVGSKACGKVADTGPISVPTTLYCVP